MTLETRAVRCVARLLNEEAPRTAAVVWDALPLSGQVFHGKYARNEIYNRTPKRRAAWAPQPVSSHLGDTSPAWAR
ncbi:MAG: DUF3830 family protein [Nocardioidaceae bacterium]